ncbi:MAG: hypothetical protein U5R31_02165 [Acidimicrobiia bacterium]|nr:hypothetical protein [Acidimicrobiia bacterium]
MALFLSTGQVPLDIMEGWLHAAATYNPFTQILEMARQGFVGEVTWGGTWPGLASLVAFWAVLGAFATRGFQKLVP